MGKPLKLRARWSKRERDMMFHYPRNAAEGSRLHYFIHHVRDPVDNKTLKEAMTEMGFDWKTLKIEIAVATASADMDLTK